MSDRYGEKTQRAIESAQHASIDIAKFSGYQQWCRTVDEMLQIQAKLAPLHDTLVRLIHDRKPVDMAVSLRYEQERAEYVRKGELVRPKFDPYVDEAIRLERIYERGEQGQRDPAKAKLADAINSAMRPVGMLLDKHNNCLYLSLTASVDKLRAEIKEKDERARAEHSSISGSGDRYQNVNAHEQPHYNKSPNEYVSIHDIGKPVGGHAESSYASVHDHVSPVYGNASQSLWKSGTTPAKPAPGKPLGTAESPYNVPVRANKVSIGGKRS